MSAPAAMPETIALVDRLRAAGHAAVVSGAGPSVLVLARHRPDDGAGAPACVAEVRERLVDRGGAVVRVRGRAAVAGKMLQAADDPGVAKAAHGGGNKRGCFVIIIAVGAVADGVAFLIRPDVGHGRKVRIEAVGRDVVREGLRIVIRALRAETAVAVHAV